MNNILLSTDIGASVAYSLSATVANDKTFEPDGQLALGVFRYADRSGGIPVMYPSFTISVKRPVNGNRTFRIAEKVTLPVPNITSPATGSGIQPLPSVAYNLICNIEWVIPEAASEAEAEQLLSLVQSLHSKQVAASDASPIVDTGTPVFDAVVKKVGPF